MGKHTPTPWRYICETYDGLEITTDSGFKTFMSKEDSTFIVRACRH